MNAAAPPTVDDVGECVELVLRRLGRRLVVAAPLAIGKPNVFLNELYRRACREPDLRLTIVTALSLNRPQAHSGLEARLLEPFVARVFGDYVDLEYVRAARAGRLPPNVEIREFYIQAGAWLDVESVQQHYISVNYSHVAGEMAALGVNLLAQEISARSFAGQQQYSLASNPDLTLDVLPYLDAERAAGREVLFVGVVNRRLPFMLGDAPLPAARFDVLLEHPRYEHDIYCPPNLPLANVEHAIGLNAAALVRDAGTLQLGIGELGDAIVYALQLRHQRNPAYREALARSGVLARCGAEIERCGGLAPFERGLYACTEMFVDGFLDLYRSGILARRVYPHAALQRLLDAGTIDERPGTAMLAALAATGLEALDASEFTALQQCGVFAADVRFEPPDRIVAPDGRSLPARIDTPAACEALARSCLTRQLDGGRLLHAGFLLGPRGFYAALRALSDVERERFCMTRISFTNTLAAGDYALRVAQRRHARFINSAMLITGLGAAVSDALASGQVVSGVGGQHDFVTMAHALPEARSVLLVRSTRAKRGQLTSNIVWNYGHTTIPRHLRDLVVSEYGIADLRGRSDRDCVAALLAITDARFQAALLADARRAGKIERGYVIPDQARDNTPAALAATLTPLRRDGLFSEFPFGTDFTAEEIVLIKALKRLASANDSAGGRLAWLARAARAPVAAARVRPYLERLRLATPRGWREQLEARLVAAAVAAVLDAS